MVEDLSRPAMFATTANSAQSLASSDWKYLTYRDMIFVRIDGAPRDNTDTKYLWLLRGTFQHSFTAVFQDLTYFPVESENRFQFIAP